MDPWALVVEILTSLAIVAGGVKYVIDRLDRRFDAIETKTADLQRQLDVQFGGNGNGIRQELNSQGKQIAAIKGHLGIPVE